MNFNGTRLYSLLMICLATPLSMFAQSNHVANIKSPKAQNKPFVFVENKGQVINQYGAIRSDIDFKTSHKGLNIFIGSQQLHYQFYKAAVKNSDKNVSSSRIDMFLVNANKNASIVKEERQPYYENYFATQSGIKEIVANSYKKITYKDVYPHIDWVLYVKNNSLEYDFIVHPGGDISNIKVKYEGASRMGITNEGKFSVRSPLGTITEEKPYAFEKESGREVATTFTLKDNILSFNVAHPDNNRTIVIDPRVQWSTYWGDLGNDYADANTVDTSGNVYLTGSTNSTSNIATTGAYQTTIAGGTYGDIYIAKFNASGSLLWSTYYGGSGNETGYAITNDGTNIYIAGNTNSSGIGTTGSYQSTYGGATGFGNPNGDAILIKFSNSGSLIWATYYGGAGNEVAYGVAYDNAGNIYMGGYTSTSNSSKIATPTAYDTSYGGNTDIFLVRFDTAGNRKWGTYYGGANYDNLSGVACDNAGNVYFTGGTSSSTDIASTGAYQTSLAGTGGFILNALLVKFDSTGNRKWATYFGGNYTSGSGIACDTSANVYLVGSTNSSTNVASANAYQTTIGSTQYDAFLARFDASGRRIWSTYYGGAQTEQGFNVALDNMYNVIMSGSSSSTSGIATTINGAYQTSNGGGTDGMLVKMTSLGQRIWGSYFGGSGSDYLSFVTYSPANGSMYVNGYTSSTSNIATSGAFHTSFGGAVFDGFLARFNQDTLVLINQPYIDTVLCPGTTWNVAYSTSYPFQSGNTFTVELSDATGSFASPTNIGSATATTSGTISCTVPLGTTIGNNYRIRIVATSPAFTSPDDYYNIHIANSIPAPTVTSNSPVCIGDSIKLSGSIGLSSVSYSWSGPLGFTSTSQNPVITPAALANAGTYTLTISHYNCPTNSASTSVTINNVFPANVIDSSNSPICVGNALHLYAGSTTTGVTYNWTGPSGFSSALQNPTIASATLGASGTYYINVKYRGCKIVDSLYAEIDPMVTPAVTITADAGDTLCAGTDATFSSSTLFGGTGPGYQWYINRIEMIGALSDVWGSPYLSNGDTIYCILTSDASCITKTTDTSNKIVVTIDPVEPPSEFIYADPGTNVAPGTLVTFHSIVTNGGTTPAYQWRLNGVDIPGATAATYATSTFNNHDVISVEVHSSSPCASPDSTLSNILNMTLGISELGEGADITLYPNPNTGSFIIKGTFNGVQEKAASIEIYNLVGQMIYNGTTTINNGEMHQQINLDSNMPNGMYLVRIRVGEQNNLIRFILGR